MSLNKRAVQAERERDKALAAKGRAERLLEDECRAGAEHVDSLMRQLSEALTAKKRAEAERDDAREVLVCNSHHVTRSGELMGRLLERAEAERNIADEEASKLWMALFWIDLHEPELTAVAAEKFGLDMEGHLRSHPTTEPAKAEDSDVTQ